MSGAGDESPWGTQKTRGDTRDGLDERVARISRYASAYEENYGFESVLVKARQEMVLERLLEWQPDTVIEAGCGTDLLFPRAEQIGVRFRRWVVVEPSPRFAALAAARSGSGPRVTVIASFLEDAVDRAREVCDGGADVVLCSSLLHEVPQPDVLLGAARRLLAEEGRLYIDVPNALSLHRRLARAAGMIEDERELGVRNSMFEQQRIYDAASLRAEMESAGFAIVGSGGCFLKPFTHAQMETMTFLDSAMEEGLRRLGQELPDLAAEIYSVGVPARTSL